MRKWNFAMKGVTLALAGALAGPALAQSGAGTGAGNGSGGGMGAAQSGVYVLKLDDGVSKRQTLQVNSAGMVRATRNLGDGNEQPSFTVDGSTVVMVYTSNNVKNRRCRDFGHIPNRMHPRRLRDADVHSVTGAIPRQSPSTWAAPAGAGSGSRATSSRPAPRSPGQATIARSR